MDWLQNPAQLALRDLEAYVVNYCTKAAPAGAGWDASPKDAVSTLLRDYGCFYDKARRGTGIEDGMRTSETPAVYYGDKTKRWFQLLEPREGLTRLLLDRLKKLR